MTVEQLGRAYQTYRRSAIIFGAMAVAFFGSPIWALLILVVLKTAFDLSLHVREHRNEGPSIAGVQPSP